MCVYVCVYIYIYIYIYIYQGRADRRPEREAHEDDAGPRCVGGLSVRWYY